MLSLNWSVILQSCQRTAEDAGRALWMRPWERPTGETQWNWYQPFSHHLPLQHTNRHFFLLNHTSIPFYTFCNFLTLILCVSQVSTHNLHSSSEDDDMESPFPNDLSLQQVGSHSTTATHLSAHEERSLFHVSPPRLSQTIRSSRWLPTLWISLGSTMRSSVSMMKTSSEFSHPFHYSFSNNQKSALKQTVQQFAMTKTSGG